MFVGKKISFYLYFLCSIFFLGCSVTNSQCDYCRNNTSATNISFAPSSIKLENNVTSIDTQRKRQEINCYQACNINLECSEYSNNNLEKYKQCRDEKQKTFESIVDNN